MQWVSQYTIQVIIHEAMVLMNGLDPRQPLPGFQAQSNEH